MGFNKQIGLNVQQNHNIMTAILYSLELIKINASTYNNVGIITNIVHLNVSNIQQ